MRNRLAKFGAYRALHLETGTDWDGVFTLGLSALIFTLTLGLGILPSLLRVYRTAMHSPISAPARGTTLLFGKRLAREGLDPEYRQRVRRAAELIRHSPDRLTIILGGPSATGGTSEAAAGADYLHSLGIPAHARIVLEQASRHTLDNLRNARELLATHPNRPTVLVSTRYHLARCSHIALSLGIAHTVCAAEDQLALDWTFAARTFKEAYFIFWFQTSITWATITRNKRILARLT